MQTSTIVSPKATSGLSTSLAAIGGYSPAVSAIVSSLVLANTTGATVSVSVTLYNGSTDYYLVKNGIINVGDSLIVGGPLAKFTLVAGWSIRASATSAASVDATMCVVEAS